MSPATMPPTTSLTAPIEELRVELRGKFGDALDGFDAFADRLGTAEYATPLVGEPAPSFALRDQDDREVRLDDLRRDSRVVLVFFRGSWCPYCDLQMRAFHDRWEEIEATGVQFAAIFPSTPKSLPEMVDDQRLAFTVLSDQGNAVTERYGLLSEFNAADQEMHRGAGIDLSTVNGGDSNWATPAPAMFVIERDGTVASACVFGDFRHRVGPDEVLAALAS
jgi:peroxiredoxin